MDKERANQIIESHGVIEVLYHDNPVWIEQIHNNGQAEVSYLDNHGRILVPISELVE